MDNPLPLTAKPATFRHLSTSSAVARATRPGTSSGVACATTVYSASYAALAPLCARAAELPPADWLQPLALIAALIASDDVGGIRRPTDATTRRPTELIAAIAPRVRALTEESMKTGGRDPMSFIYLLQAASAFDGDLFWGRELDRLAEGEFEGESGMPALSFVCDWQIWFLHHGRDLVG